jgi:peptidylprolyl isomerase
MEGDGEPIKADNLAAIDLIAWEWGETEPIASLDTFASGQPLVLAVRADDSTLVGLSRVIVGHNVGARVLGVIPPSEGALASALSLDEGTTIVVSIDIREQFDKDAQAEKDAKPTDAKVGPKIDGALGGPATVSIPADVEAPTEISTTVIATGSGPAVEDGQQILIHYSATDWAGTADGDTWTADRGPVAVAPGADPYGDGSVLSAFSGLVGVPIGSRVLILTPGKEGSYLAEAIVLDIVAVVQGNDSSAEGDEGDEGDEGEDSAEGDEDEDSAEGDEDGSGATGAASAEPTDAASAAAG